LYSCAEMKGDRDIQISLRDRPDHLMIYNPNAAATPHRRET